MRIYVLLLMALVLASCSVFQAGKVNDRREELYKHNNNNEFCEKNPTKCINNIPWM